MFQCFFYKIYNSENDKIYVGSTKGKLTTRFYRHKRCDKNNKFQTHMREIGVDKFTIVELERKEVNDKQEQLKLETEWLEKLQPELNERRPFSSDQKKLEIARDYKKKHKEGIEEYNKKFYSDNKEREKERSRIYKEENKEKCHSYSLRYSLDNKELIKEKAKQRRDRNKELGRFKCTKCNINFSDGYALRKHNTKKHN